MTVSERANSAPPRGRPFQKGNAGRPKGARNKSTLIAQSLLQEEQVNLARKAIELAKDGDARMLKFVLERTLPRGRPCSIELPELNTTLDAEAAMVRIFEALRTGELSISEATALAALVETYVRAFENSNMEKRLEAIERQLKEAHEFALAQKNRESRKAGPRRGRKNSPVSAIPA